MRLRSTKTTQTIAFTKQMLKFSCWNAAKTQHWIDKRTIELILRGSFLVPSDRYLEGSQIKTNIHKKEYDRQEKKKNSKATVVENKNLCNMSQSWP